MVVIPTMDKIFIVSDKEYSEKMVLMGYNFLYNNNGFIYMSQGNSNMKFSELDKTKVAVTNKMTF